MKQMPTQDTWIAHLNERLPHFLASLQVPDQPGAFHPCVTGMTTQGEQLRLGFSCFALKLFYMLKVWDTLPQQEQANWLTFLKSFQADDEPSADAFAANAFIDPPVIAYLVQQRPSHWQKLKTYLFGSSSLTAMQRALIAETKQAIATLIEIGDMPQHVYRAFPLTAEGVHSHLSRLNWAQPWGAGGQAAALAVFLQTQAPQIVADTGHGELLAMYRQFLDQLADKQSGAYFQGALPEHGQLTNGAMKVLTALDWLDTPIHYPEALIDTVLAKLPSSTGCHLVDAVYVLYRCQQQTQHRRIQIQTYCEHVLEMIYQHHNEDGGFSYHIKKSQMSYYGVPISEGRPISDIHGTCLITWALAMIAEILEDQHLDWRIIKP